MIATVAGICGEPVQQFRMKPVHQRWCSSLRRTDLPNLHAITKATRGLMAGKVWPHTLPPPRDIALQPAIQDVAELEERLSSPPDYVIESLAKCPGDTIVLGVGGKMGPSLTRMLVRACCNAGDDRSITAVSRFTNPEHRETLESIGVRTIAGDLLTDGFIDELPDVANVIHMTGMKFGTGDNAAATWAMNAYLPTLVCQRYRDSRIMAFSTGNVYPLVPYDGDWSRETDTLDPVGEYGMSALGRERMFQYFANKNKTPVSLVRLNYAVEMRYGVLVDIANKVLSRQPVDVSMGYANVIWQRDANAMAIAALADATSPAHVINVAGPELVVVADVARKFADEFDISVEIVGQPSQTALLNDGSASHQRFGRPSVSLDQLIAWIADWLRRDQPTLGKPTHFEVRSGKF